MKRRRRVRNGRSPIGVVDVKCEGCGARTTVTREECTAPPACKLCHGVMVPIRAKIKQYKPA